MSTKVTFSDIVINSETLASGPIRRSSKSDIQGHLALHGCFTSYETFRRSVELHAPLPSIGFRTSGPSGEPSKFEFYTYEELDRLVYDFSTGLVKEGLLSRSENSEILMLGIFMKNCPAWIISEQSSFRLGAATLPIFEAFRAEDVEFILKQTAVATVVCSTAETRKLLLVARNVPTLKNIVVHPPIGGSNGAGGRGVATILAEIRDEAAVAAPALRVLSWADVLASGREAVQPAPPSPPSPKDVATLCYTSGTTGQPKGAIITHQNLITVVTGGLEGGMAVGPGDSYLSFLPLPHIFERIVCTAVLSSGGQIGFYRGDPLGIIEDLKALRPTLLCAVPRLLTRIHDKVMDGGRAAKGMKGALFRAALEDKLSRMRRFRQTTHWFWDPLVFGPIKRAVGMDRVRRLVSGGAPLSAEVMEFFRILLGTATCHEGYGQTETTGATTMTAAEDLDTGHVGAPFPSLEVRMLDVADMGYFHTDTEHNGRPCFGRGEVCVRGPGVFSGYFKNPEETRDAFTPDGWLLSGDIGMWTPAGQLVIIDRRKNLIKLAQGEYVAVEKVETILGRAALVAQIFVHGDGLQNSVVAVVVPDEDEARKWLDTDDAGKGCRADLSGEHGEAKQTGDFAGSNLLAQICGSDLFREAVLAQVVATGRAAGLKGFEIPSAVWLEHQMWATSDTPVESKNDGGAITVGGVGNGLLTPTLKLRRGLARKKYARQIDEMYARLRPNDKAETSVSRPLTTPASSPTRSKL